MKTSYVHGYEARERVRLQDQALTLTQLLHADTAYPPASTVLEAGCGVGAQTVTLARNSPRSFITSIDISEKSLALARDTVQASGARNVTFAQADIFDLPFAAETFDHVFVCFVLEHVDRPEQALQCLKRVLKRGGTFTAIEGDHGSAYFHPDSESARRAIQCLVDLQRRAGGNPAIGRALYPLLFDAGFTDINISPRMVYVDSSKPDLVEAFTKRTFTAMIEGVRDASIASGIIDANQFDRGIRDLYRTSEAGGVFCYTFFKAFALRQ